MPAPDLENMIRSSLEDLKRLYLRKLPVRVGVAVRDSVRQNFRQGNFYGGERWQTPLRTSLGFRGAAGQYGPLLSGSNHLMMNTDYQPLPGKVIIRNTAVYAATHNDGEEIGVTERMKRFFWAKHRSSGSVWPSRSPAAVSRYRAGISWAQARKWMP